MSARGNDLRPLVVKEARLLSRSRFAFWGLFFLLLIIGGGVFIFWMNSGSRLSLNQRALFARGLFYTVAALLLVFLGMISPMITSISISDERERKTFDMLLCTGISPRRLLLGKWLGALAYQAVLVVCLLPILTVVFQFGGVGAQEFLITGGLLAATSGTYGMLGLAISAANARSMKALAKAVTWTLGLMFGSFVLCCISFVVSPLSALLFVAMPSRMPNLWLFSLHGAFQLLVFLVMLRRARRELEQPEKAVILLAQEQLERAFPQVVEWQRHLVPDPIAPPPCEFKPIPDNVDPLYRHEVRQAQASQTMIILGCVGMLLTCFVPFMNQQSRAEFTLGVVMKVAVSFTALLMPLAAAMVLSREHENGTLDLLMTAPITEWGVVWSKFRAAFRMMTIACAITAAPGLIMTVLMHHDYFSQAVALMKLATVGLAFLALYAAMGVLLSSVCRRNVTALSLSMSAGGLMLLSPVLLGGVFRFLQLVGSWALDLEPGPTVRVPLSFVSPLLMPDLRRAGLAPMSFNGWLFVLTQSAGIAALTLTLLWAASQKLARRSAS